jgi:CheY-like chemotaxis protein
VVDLKLAGGASGLACVQMLHAHDPAMLIVVLTGYASIATAVEAIKLGACHYLAKPANTDDIEAAFGRAEGDADVALTERPPRSRRWSGSASTRCWPRPASTSRRRRGGSACTGARWRASWRSSGSSRPFLFGVLRGPLGWTLFGAICAAAVLGVSAKLFNRLQHPLWSTGLYVAMGWMALMAAVPLYERMSAAGLGWLVAGGLFYTAGAVVFLFDNKVRYAHSVWHLFVLAGSTCHFFAVLWHSHG